MGSHSDSIDSYKQPSGIGYPHYCPPARPAACPTHRRSCGGRNPGAAGCPSPLPASSDTIQARGLRYGLDHGRHQPLGEENDTNQP